MLRTRNAEVRQPGNLFERVGREPRMGTCCQPSSQVHPPVATGAAKPVLFNPIDFCLGQKRWNIDDASAVPAAERIVSTRAADTSIRFSDLRVALPTRLDTLSSARAILELR